ncbi:MAG TPA: hypothetical protein VIN58_07350 [Roseateles sp.]
MTAEGNAGVSTGPGLKWMLACAGLCAAAFFYVAFVSTNGSGGLAYEIGADLPYAALLAGLLHLVFKRRESSTTGWLGFLLVFASLIAASAISTNRSRDEARQVVTELQQTLSQVQAANTNGSQLPSMSPQGKPARSGASKAAEIVRAMVNRTLTQRRDYEGELEAMGWSRVLDAQRLGRDTGLKESHAMIRQAKDIVEKYKLKTPELFARSRRDIEIADLSFNDKQSMLKGFDNAIERGKQQMADMWSLEEQAMSQFENVFNLLSAKRGAWQIEKGQLTFHRQADLDVFNNYIAQVQAIVKKQEEMQNAALDKAKSSLDQLAR